MRVLVPYFEWDFEPLEIVIGCPVPFKEDKGLSLHPLLLYTCHFAVLCSKLFILADLCQAAIVPLIFPTH